MTRTGTLPRKDLPTRGEIIHLRQLEASLTFRDMADAPNIKPEAHRLVDGLPDTASWDDLMYEIYVRQAIEAGLADAQAGRVLPHEDALARIRSRIRRAS